MSDQNEGFVVVIIADRHGTPFAKVSLKNSEPMRLLKEEFLLAIREIKDASGRSRAPLLDTEGRRIPYYIFFHGAEIPLDKSLKQVGVNSGDTLTLHMDYPAG